MILRLLLLKRVEFHLHRVDMCGYDTFFFMLILLLTEWFAFSWKQNLGQEHTKMCKQMPYNARYLLTYEQMEGL